MLKTFTQWIKSTKTTQLYLKPAWEKVAGLSWRKFFGLAWVAPGLETLVSIILKLGTLALVSFFLLFFFRLFKDQGYVLQSFSVPKALEEQGYSGQVIALRLQDELAAIKEIAETVKEDSLQLREDQGDIDLSVLGVGLSLRSLAFQLRELMGRENKSLRGEITRIGNHYEAQVRMTGYPRIVKETQIGELSEKEALNQLIRQLAEGVLMNTDPYRLALLYRKEKQYDKAIETVRYLLRTNEQEAHWAYLCWGAMLNETGDKAGAINKFERAIEVKPDFSLPYVNISWLYINADRTEEGLAAMQKAVDLEPDNLWRYNSLAWMYHNVGQPEQADSIYLVLMNHPKNNTPETRMDLATNWAQMKMQKDDISAAKKIIDDYVSDLGENVMSYLVQGVSAFAELDTFAALENFQQAFELDPGDDAAVASNISIAAELGYCERSIEFYRRAKWERINFSNIMSSWNKAAMCFNTLGQHDSAYHLIQRTIKLDPESSYPYTTLAETFAFRLEMDSCYYFMDKALAMGFNPKNFDYTDPPYETLIQDFTFQQLLKKYEREKNDL